jgi:hypothetical protein
MATPARWIRLHPPHLPAMHAACAGFASAQGAGAAPAVLWARIEDGRDNGDHAFAIVAPLKYLPGRRTRWAAWGLAPLVAAYRQRGLSAYCDADRICLRGQPISDVRASSTGACAVVLADFTAWGEGFIEALRQRVEAQYGWQFDHSWPADAERSAMAVQLAGEAAGAG